MGKKFLFLVLILATASGVQAASNSAGFRCDVTKKGCSCDINIEGDCDAMKKNCRDGKIGSCAEVNGKQVCVCDMANSRGQLKEKIGGQEKLPLPAAQ